jgi:hypothetical protein
MKRFFVIGIMASGIFAGSVQAQSEKPELPWVKVEESDDGEVTYVNVETIKDLGGGIKQAWRILSYPKPRVLRSGAKYSSDKIRERFNCIEESITTLSFVTYSKTYGTGDVVLSGDFKPHEVEWRAVVPDSVGETLFKFVCDYK